MNPKHNQEWLAGDDHPLKNLPQIDYIEALLRGGLTEEEARKEADELYRNFQ